MAKTFFMGELLMRLECPEKLRFLQTDSFQVHYTGAELNSAVMMHCLGATDLHLITAVPQNALGDAALNASDHWRIGTESCVRRPGRLGTFFLEQGFGIRPSSVIYDRAGSVFSQTPFETYDLDHVLTPGAYLYVSGTMPALNPAMLKTTKQVFQCAKEHDCTVCFDLNFRATLWDFDTAAAAFRDLLEDVDLLFGNEHLAENALLAKPSDLCGKYGLKAAALTRRTELDSAENVCSAAIYDADGGHYESTPVRAKMLDRIGGGDAFSGAALFAIQNGWDFQRTADFAVAAMVLKQTVSGDFGIVTPEEVERVLSGGEIAVRR